MKPLVATVRALRELATGISPDAIPTSSRLFGYEGSVVDVLLSVGDSHGDQRVIQMRDGNVSERYVPDHLSHVRRDVLSRMANFAERVRVHGPVSLPRGWRQYKHNNLVAFFAVPSAHSVDSRWVVELVPGDQADVIFWRTTTSAMKATLKEFESSKPSTSIALDADWSAAVNSASEYFDSLRRSQPSDVEILLDPRELSASKGWSYEQWLLAVSDDQRSFIEAATSKSIRLRGPAGSGKTLALTLKAVREVLNARDLGDSLRVLVVTHSWSLATEIANSIDSMGVGSLDEIDVFPLLEVAQTISPQYAKDSSGFTLIGSDSFSGKQAQLDEILDVIDDFVSSDWITYRGSSSDSLRTRLDSTGVEERFALAWDLLVEFGSVIGAAAIFPGAGSEARYFQLPRASWMLPLYGRDDLRVVFSLYKRYMESLDARSLLTSDQLLADVLSHLVTHAWNRARRTYGYDLIFVDEFHLFSPLERQVLHYLSRDVKTYPRVFMAVDPRQSPSEAFIGVAAHETRSSTAVAGDGDLGDIANFELTTVHRFTPEILNLIKHVHHEFPTLDLGQDWDVNFAAVESANDAGQPPRLVVAATRSGEENDITNAVHSLYPAGRLALAVVDVRQWHRFSEFAWRLGQSGKFHVSTVSGRADIDGLGYRRKGLVVGPAEYLAGLQFEQVLVAGVPEMQVAASTSNERTRLLSLLYLALSRAQREVRVFVNEDDGGAPEVLSRAVSNGLMLFERGSLA